MVGREDVMEKTFALKDHFHPNEGKIALYHTFDDRVVFIVFLKKPDWPNREKEEVFRCPTCKGFIFPRGIIRARGKDYKHICRGGPRSALEAERGRPAEEKEVFNDRIDGNGVTIAT